MNSSKPALDIRALFAEPLAEHVDVAAAVTLEQLGEPERLVGRVQVFAPVVLPELHGDERGVFRRVNDARRRDQAGASAREPPPMSGDHFVAVGDARDHHRLLQAVDPNARREFVHRGFVHRRTRRQDRLVDETERDLAELARDLA
jgi:hypothetical protein